MRTFDFRQYDFVAQVERLCSHQRLDNGELAVFGDRMYVTFHTTGEAGRCITSEGRPGADWQLRLKVSQNYRSTPAHFTDLGGHEGAEIVRDLCIANGSSDGFWEPMIFRSADQTIRIAYTDDTPSEVPDGNCNQFVRVLGDSEDHRKVISNDAVGDCTGDERQRMAVVAESASGSYGMVYESLGTP